ncbi:MAG: metallophosphoesterase [Chitinophagaceae bacterium]
MKKFGLFLLSALLISQVCSSQKFYDYYTNQRYHGVVTFDYLRLPWDSAGHNRHGDIVYYNSVPYIFDTTGGGWTRIAKYSDLTGGGTWGSISGSLNDQTDLRDSLRARQRLIDTLVWDATRSWVQSQGYLTSVDTTDIANFSVKVRSLFSAGLYMNYLNGVYSADTSSSGFSNYYVRRKDSATAINFNGYLTRTSSPPAWNLLGNTGTNPSTNFVGNQDSIDLSVRTNNIERIRVMAKGDVRIKDTLETSKINSKHSEDTPYEIVVIPDTQDEVRFSFPYGRAIFDWLHDSAVYYNVQAIMQVGDLTDWNTQVEWDTITNWFAKIPSTIPVQVVPGNHDYYNGFAPATRDAVRYKATISAYLAGKSYYGGNFNGSVENYFSIFSAGNKKYMSVGLEFMPRDSVVTWAGHIIDSVYAVEPDREVIIVTHAFIDYYGEIASDTSVSSTAEYGMSADNDPQELWDKLIKKKVSIKWVFNGHFLIPATWAQMGLTGTIVSTGEAGNMINQLFVNYQDDVHWGDGYIMRLKFFPATGQVQIRYYSTYFNADDPRKAGFTLQNPSVSVTSSMAVKGVLSVAQDMRVAGNLKVESLHKKSIPFVWEDHALKTNDSLFYDAITKLVNANGYKVNAPFGWQSNLTNHKAYLYGVDSNGVSAWQIRASTYNAAGNSYIASIYFGDSTGYNNPYGWNNTVGGAKALFRAKWGGYAVGQNSILGTMAGYGLGIRGDSYNNAFLGADIMTGDSTFCRFCTFVGYGVAQNFVGGEDITIVGDGSGVNLKPGSFGVSATGSNVLEQAYAYQVVANGKGSFANSDTVINSIAIGARAARDGIHKGSIIIGTFAHYTSGSENILWIDNDGLDGVAPLIEGLFVTNPGVTINGDFTVVDTLTNITYGVGDSTNRMASTAFVKRAVAAGGGGGGSGEVNTASNLGGGLANWDSKSGVDLRFNSFAAADFDLASNLISIDATLKSTWNSKQDALVSATNIKTINGSSILGSGDLSVSGSLVKGTTTISSSADKRVLYDSLGVLSNNASFVYNPNGTLTAPYITSSANYFGFGSSYSGDYFIDLATAGAGYMTFGVNANYGFAFRDNGGGLPFRMNFNGYPAIISGGGTAIALFDANMKTWGYSQYEKHILLKDISAPSTPASGYAALYTRADSLRYLNDNGIEFTLGVAGGSGETNTASNLGGGLANYSTKVGVDLQFNSFTASDFNLASNLISIDYTNGQAATSGQKGFLTAADWTTFNSKGSGTVTSITLTQPSAGFTITGSGTPITTTGTPTFALANDLAALEGLASTGIAVRTASDTWAQRTLTDGTGIAWTNGSGVSGNPVAAIIGYDQWNNSTVNTVSTSATTLATITPPSASRGILEVTVIGTETSTASKGLTGKKFVHWKHDGGTLTILQIVDEQPDYRETWTTATWTVDVSAGTLRVRVTADNTNSTDWNATYKLKYNLYSL